MIIHAKHYYELIMKFNFIVNIKHFSKINNINHIQKPHKTDESNTAQTLYPLFFQFCFLITTILFIFAK
jgi:hypothetical protein